MIFFVFSMLAVLSGVVSLLGADVARRLASGDPSALRLMYDTHAGRAFALALRVLRSKQEAEDVVQDTFLEVWRRADQFDPNRGDLGAWIMSMARSRAIDRVRRARVRARVGTQAEAADPPEPSLTPERDAELNQSGRAVREVLLSLPPEQREALELAYFEGCSHQQIAERTGAALGTVKTRVRLGLHKLSEQLEGLR